MRSNNANHPACHCGGAEKIAELEAQVKRLKIEMEVRLRMPSYPDPPSCYGMAPLRNMWLRSFCNGWEGKPTLQVNSRCCNDGHAAGTSAVQAEIEKRVRESDDHR